MMKLETTTITAIINGFLRRGEIARAAGGISMVDVQNGAPVPDGWQLDDRVQYFLPPNVVLL